MGLGAGPTDRGIAEGPEDGRGMTSLQQHIVVPKCEGRSWTVLAGDEFGTTIRLGVTPSTVTGAKSATMS